MSDWENVFLTHVRLEGVRQGCSLSPLLYIIYDESMMREATVDTHDGVSVSEHVINVIRLCRRESSGVKQSTGITEVNEQRQ